VIALEIVIGLQIDPDSAAWWRTRARREARGARRGGGSGGDRLLFPHQAFDAYPQAGARLR
jgi:hypothetical protein